MKLNAVSDAPVPMFPVQDEDLERFLSAVRYEAFAQLSVFLENNDEFFAITKNGLLATVKEGKLLNIVLAVGSNGGQIKLNLEGRDDLRFQLQASQPKIIFAEKPAELEPSKLTVGDWEFSFSKLDWQTDEKRGTRIILKYSNDISIKDWLSGNETEDTVFKESLSRVRNADDSTPKHYEEFINTVNDQNFTGMIILNCKATYEGNNEDVKKLLGTVKGTITAHHIIIRTGQMNNDLTLKPSIVNAVIDYSEKEAQTTYSYENENPPDYDFATTAVIAIIQRGLTISLKTTSELLINKLFDCPTHKSGDGGNALLIDGELRSRDGVPVFEYTLRSTGEYTLSTSHLDRVNIDGVHFGGGVFTLRGELGFRAPQSGLPDLFGYGFGAPLRFVNLQILSKGDRMYEIDYSNLALRQSDSRAGSFPRLFSASASAVIRETKEPAKLGIVPLDTTPIKNSDVAEFITPWWRISYPLTIGNLGKLSGNADFTLTVVLCWREESFYAGVIPPGGMLGAGLAMSGVLSFTAKEMKLGPLFDDENEVMAYELVFTEIALRLLKCTIPPSGVVGLAVQGGKEGIAWKAVYDKGGK